MTQPLPPEILSPEGFPLWLNPYSGTYSRSRSYALRMQRNYARGLSQSEARGHQATATGSESQTRRLRFEQRYGISLRLWERWRKLYIAEINRRSYPSAPSRSMQFRDGSRVDPRIFISDILMVKQLYDGGYRDPVLSPGSWEEWVELRLRERLSALVAYQDEGDFMPGRIQYGQRNGTWIGFFGAASAPPVELWYYH